MHNRQSSMYVGIASWPGKEKKKKKKDKRIKSPLNCYRATNCLSIMTESAWSYGAFFPSIITTDELAKLWPCWPAFASSMWLLMGPFSSSHSGFYSSLFFLPAIHTQTYGSCPSPPLGIVCFLCPSMLHIIVLCLNGAYFRYGLVGNTPVSSRNFFSLYANCQSFSPSVSYPIKLSILTSDH